MPERIFQVSEFNEFINTYLRQVREVVIEGEITEVNLSQGRWLFVTLKDQSATLSVFAVAYQISGWQVLEPGMLVHVTGSPGLHQKSGKFSFNATQIVPAGEGALRLAFEKLRLQLEREGLFDPARKRSLPVFPQRIGLITSKTGEAYNDFVKVLSARMGGLKIFLYPVSVQGKESVSSILRAFDYFNSHHLNLDLLVLTRGGGSLEDLQAFNDEKVVRAVFSSQFPVVCAVGHERDVSLCDFVADLRASTPSNAAELIVKNKFDLIGQVNLLVRNLDTKITGLINQRKVHILRQVDSLNHAINIQISAFKYLVTRFSRQPLGLSVRVSTSKKDVAVLVKNMSNVVGDELTQNSIRLDNLVRLFHTLNYQEILKRGFSITTNSAGSIVRSISAVSVGSALLTRLADGTINSVVNSADHDQNH